MLADIPFTREWHVPTGKVITDWRLPVPPDVMENLFWQAAGPLISDDEPSAVLLVTSAALGSASKYTFETFVIGSSSRPERVDPAAAWPVHTVCGQHCGRHSDTAGTSPVGRRWPLTCANVSSSRIYCTYDYYRHL